MKACKIVDMDLVVELLWTKNFRKTLRSGDGVWSFCLLHVPMNAIIWCKVSIAVHEQDDYNYYATSIIYHISIHQH